MPIAATIVKLCKSFRRKIWNLLIEFSSALFFAELEKKSSMRPQGKNLAPAVCTMQAPSSQKKLDKTK
jgi:hypothetical protein